MMHSSVYLTIICANLTCEVFIVGVQTILIKIIILIMFAFIFFSLGSALYFLVKDKSGSDRMVKALSWRIGLSIVLFIILMIAYALGWIAPHSIV